MDKDEREQQIETAAYKVFAEKGFKGASMLAIAKAAKASNETLYRWYGDKTGLFCALVDRNAARIGEELQEARTQGGTGMAALRAVAEALLAMLVSERAVALNRAAAGDLTGRLGALLSEHGRGRVLPLLEALLDEALGPDPDPAARAECFITLLVGDLQIKRATHAMAPLRPDQIIARTDLAIARLTQLYPPAQGA